MFQEFVGYHKKVYFLRYLKHFYQVTIQTPRTFSIFIAVELQVEIAMTEKAGEKLCM